MSRTRFVLALLYLVAGALAATYLAAFFYFVLCKAMPHNIGFDTWLRYWDAYGEVALQRKRLLTAAAAAAMVVFGIPAVAIITLARTGRSLHGDARWATHAEIRKAGLL